MPHVHASAAGSHRRTLIAVLLITLAIFVVQLVGGIVSGSLALVADAGHNFTDVAGIGLALLAISFAARPATDGRTFGYLRLEILAAVVNAVFLFAVAAYVLFEAIQRWSDPPEIASGLMLTIALVGLVANAISLWLLRDAQHESLNMRGAYLEVMGDLAGSAAVVLAAIVINVTGWRQADAVA